MNTRYLIWIFVAVILGAIMFANARMQFKSAKNEPVKQYIEEAGITVTAPQLEKKTVNESQIKENYKDLIEYAAVYGVFYKKTEYSVIYMLYKNEITINDAVQNIIGLFADKSFKYEITESEENGDEKARISGTFDINGKKFGAEVLLIKRDLNFWKVISVYPYSEENKELAQNYINSVVIDEVISRKAEKK
ncbi:MAG: hypothetical protein FWG57_07120 [Endomicrobia bacterium]|jgi:hypothetical protein|nr:hypothetical protein [Endomicrobiia bacterium]